MPKPQPIKEPGKIIGGSHGAPTQIEHPRTGQDGRPITQRPIQNGRGQVIAPSGNHVTVINNTTVINNIRVTQNRWNRRDRGYYWHDWDGYRMCHHYDGYWHWWGFYVGPVYFWTVYWNDYYWWYDPYWHRYCYWRHGYWWWQDPARVEVIYIYRDGGYYEYHDTTGGVVVTPDPTPPVEAPPADPNPAPNPDPAAKSYYSLDGTRTVQVTGDAKDAYLYDTADPPSFEPKYLASGVNEVRFKLDSDGKLLQILTLTDDGSFTMFDKDGNPLNVGQLGPEAIGGNPASVDAGFAKSALFGALKSGSIAW